MFERFSKKKIFFWFLTAAVPLVFMEVFLRVYFATQVGADVLLYGMKSSRYQSVFDPVGASDRKEDANRSVDGYNNLLQGYWKYSPYQDAVEHNDAGEVFKVEINSRGFRGKDFETAKKPGTLRVVTLGASSTFGYHDKDNETYPFYLQDSLWQTLRENPCRQIKSVEVVNLGIPHLESDNIYSLFVAEALPLEPDVVTFYEGINDAHVDRPATGPPALRKSWIKRTISRIYFELRSRSIAIALIGNLHGTLASRFNQNEIRIHMEGKAGRFLSNLERINEECRKRNILFVVANQQAKSQMIEREKMKGVTYAQEVDSVQRKLAAEGNVSMGGRDLITHEALMKAEVEWASTNGVPFVDVIKALDSDRHCLLTWVHLDAEGNRIVASAFAREIVKHLCQE